MITSARRGPPARPAPAGPHPHHTVVGSDPLYMLTGVIPATEKVLARCGLTLSDIDLFEVNEAFAPVVLAWARDTGADLAKTNVNGGAIAIGHPLGASGARIMTTLVNALEQRDGRYGLQTMCEGGGMANATIIERLGRLLDHRYRASNARNLRDPLGHLREVPSAANRLVQRRYGR